MNGDQADRWQWQFGQNATSSIQNPVYTFTYPGQQVVKLIVTDINGCSDTIQKNVLVYDLPVADFISDTVCSGELINLTDNSSSQNGSIISWTWDMGNGTVLGSQNPVYSYTNIMYPASFNVLLSVEDNLGCADTVHHYLLVNPKPIADFMISNTCFLSTTQFSDLSTSNGGNIISWKWNFGVNAISTLQYSSS